MLIKHSGSVRQSLARSRLLVTYLDRDVEFVWTLKHLCKTNWQRSSSVQIKPRNQKQHSFISNDPLQGSILVAGLPRCSTFFPLIIGELLDLCPVITHDEDVAIGLWRVRIERLVFKSHAAA